MNVDQQQMEDLTVLRPRGPLIGTDAEQFEIYLAKAIEERAGRVVLDASSVPFADSRGLEVLADATEKQIRNGMALKLAGANETLREALELTELAALFEYYDDVDAAVESF